MTSTVESSFSLTLFYSLSLFFFSYQKKKNLQTPILTTFKFQVAEK